MLRFTCATLLFLATLYSLNGLIKNVWLADFKDKYYEIYFHRAYLNLFALVLSFAAFVTVLLWGRMGSIRLWLRKRKLIP
jgi:hypothetical protein